MLASEVHEKTYFCHRNYFKLDLLGVDSESLWKGNGTLKPLHSNPYKHQPARAQKSVVYIAFLASPKPKLNEKKVVGLELDCSGSEFPIVGFQP